MEELLNSLPVPLRLVAVVGMGIVFALSILWGKKNQGIGDGEIKEMFDALKLQNSALLTKFEKHEEECDRRSTELIRRIYEHDKDIAVLNERIPHLHPRTPRAR